MVPAMVRNLSALVPALVILTACENPVPHEEDERVLAVTAVQAPATVIAAQSFIVNLTVHFGGCVGFDRIDTRALGSRLEVTAVGIEISGPNIACPDNLLSAKKELTVPGASPGTLTLVVRQPNGAATEREVQVVAP